MHPCPLQLVVQEINQALNGLCLLAAARSPLSFGVHIRSKSICRGAVGYRDARDDAVDIFNSGTQNAKVHEARSQNLYALIFRHCGKIEVVRNDKLSRKQVVYGGVDVFSVISKLAEFILDAP